MVVYTLLQCTEYQVYFRSVSKNRCFNVNLYCAIVRVAIFVCVCELQQGYSTSILLDNRMLDQAQKSTQYIHHGFFKRYQHNFKCHAVWYRRYTEHTARSSPLRRSCHCMRICPRHATARKSAASSFVRLSRLISVQRDESEWVSSMGRAYQTLVNYVKKCASQILPSLCIYTIYIHINFIFIRPVRGIASRESLDFLWSQKCFLCFAPKIFLCA